LLIYEEDNESAIISLFWDNKEKDIFRVDEDPLNANVTVFRYLGNISEGNNLIAWEWIDSTCRGEFGNKYSIPTDYVKFIDGNDTIPVTCELATVCPSTLNPNWCNYQACVLQERPEGDIWPAGAGGLAHTSPQQDCSTDDEPPADNYIDYDYQLRHDNKTDVRCRRVIYALDEFELCGIAPKKSEPRFDWWLNNNTPMAQNVTLTPSKPKGGNISCNYDFYDGDGDGQDAANTSIRWFVNGLPDVPFLNSSNHSTDLHCKNYYCSVKVADDVFVTGNEAGVISNTVSSFCEPREASLISPYAEFVNRREEEGGAVALLILLLAV